MNEETLKNDDPTGPEYVFSCQSIFGYKSREPGVQVVVNGADFSTVMSTTEARNLALNLLMCAEAAEHDAFLMYFFKEKVGVNEERKMAAILLDFRKWRERLLYGNTPEDDEESGEA